MLYRRRTAGGYTPPPAVTPRYWVGGTGTWDQSTTTHWAATSGGAGGASVPTQYNDVIFDASSGAGTVTLSANAPCNSFQAISSAITTFTHNASVTLSVGSNSATGPSNKALDLSGLTTYTKGGGASSVISFVSSVPTQQTINYGTQTVSGQTFNGAGGSWRLLSAMTQFSTNAPLTLTAGSLDTNGQTITMGNFFGSGGSTRSLTLGATSITLTTSGAGRWDVTNSAGMTLSAASSTIILNGSTGGFRGGGLTYGIVNLTGSGAVVVTGANTYGTFNRSNATACSVSFPNGITQTVTTAGGWSVNGTSGNLVTITSDSATHPWTLSVPSGTVNSNFISLQDSTATGGATFHAGANSTNVSGNTGWLFP